MSASPKQADANMPNLPDTSLLDASLADTGLPDTSLADR
jgi:hypothetical protein